MHMVNSDTQTNYIYVKKEELKDDCNVSKFEMKLYDTDFDTMLKIYKQFNLEDKIHIKTAEDKYIKLASLTRDNENNSQLTLTLQGKLHTSADNITQEMLNSINQNYQTLSKDDAGGSAGSLLKVIVINFYNWLLMIDEGYKKYFYLNDISVYKSMRNKCRNISEILKEYVKNYDNEVISVLIGKVNDEEVKNILTLYENFVREVEYLQVTLLKWYTYNPNNQTRYIVPFSKELQVLVSSINVKSKILTSYEGFSRVQKVYRNLLLKITDTTEYKEYTIFNGKHRIEEAKSDEIEVELITYKDTLRHIDRDKIFSSHLNLNYIIMNYEYDMFPCIVKEHSAGTNAFKIRSKLYQYVEPHKGSTKTVYQQSIRFPSDWDYFNNTGYMQAPERDYILSFIYSQYAYVGWNVIDITAFNEINKHDVFFINNPFLITKFSNHINIDVTDKLCENNDSNISSVAKTFKIKY